MPTTLIRAASALILATALVSAASPAFAKTATQKNDDYNRCLSRGAGGDQEAVAAVCCVGAGGTLGSSSDTTTANGTQVHVWADCMFVSDLGPAGPTGPKHPLPTKIDVTAVASK